MVDLSGRIAAVNERARGLFSMAPTDIGRPLQDLEISYRPLELRSCIEQAQAENRVITVTDVERRSAQGEPAYFDVQVSSLINGNHQLLGVSITFLDVTQSKQLREELEQSNQELESAYEELQSTNEELETTNEELQSTNEELETTNEELQSTNEELETMNEELQSTNEELQTLNHELQRRSEELNHSNAFLESIFASLKGAVVVVDRALQVQIWNHRAEDMWGLTQTEALGQNFLNLDIGLPVEQLRQPLHGCFTGSVARSTEVVIPAINRRGRAIECRITSTPLSDTEGAIWGVLLSMEGQGSSTP